VTETDVAQVVESTWDLGDDRLSVLEHLSRYGVEPYEREVTRVQLAILKLSQGQLDRVPGLVAAA
jgi:hypothetical protein